eukprot:Polyplicarium_translucidae@DN2711_c0_g1_i4.p1
MLGVRKSLLLGTVVAFLSRVGLALSPSRYIALGVLFTILPASSALTSPVLKLALRKFTSVSDRTFAFQASYMVLNIACILAAAQIFCWRIFLGSETSFLDYQRAVLMCAAIVSVAEICIAMSLREVLIDESSSRLISFEPSRSSQSIRELIADENFLRYMVTTTAVAFGVGSLMRQFGATFPKYVNREFGIWTPYEAFLVLNPALILIFLPLFSHFGILANVKMGTALTLGCTISCLAPLALAAWPRSYAACGATFLIFTLGEAVWSPKFLEYCVSSAPCGREGIALAFASAPKFCSRVLAGGLSGVLLATFCPDHGERHSGKMWLAITAFAFTTPVILVSAQRWLFVASQKPVQAQETTALFDHDDEDSVSLLTATHRLLAQRDLKSSSSTTDIETCTPDS